MRTEEAVAAAWKAYKAYGEAVAAAWNEQEQK